MLTLSSAAPYTHVQAPIQELQKMKAYMAEREITKMNANDMKELNINELEQVNGGRSKSLLEIWFENQYLSNKNDD